MNFASWQDASGLLSIGLILLSTGLVPLGARLRSYVALSCSSVAAPRGRVPWKRSDFSSGFVPRASIAIPLRLHPFRMRLILYLHFNRRCR
jgi:hypothetical protein